VVASALLPVWLFTEPLATQTTQDRPRIPLDRRQRLGTGIPGAQNIGQAKRFDEPFRYVRRDPGVQQRPAEPTQRSTSGMNRIRRTGVPATGQLQTQLQILDTYQYLSSGPSLAIQPTKGN